MELEVLVENFRNKDSKAFEKLYEMYSDNICGVINSIVKNSDIAQEICQDVFVKAWKNSESYNASKGRFFTWMLNIARNAAIDEVRSKSHKNSKQNLSSDFFVNILEDKNDLNNQVDTIGIKNLLTNLKDKCVQIIQLLYFQGYTQKEAAEELAIPVGTVKTRNRSCISQIRGNLSI
ncbi:sigma-70 family RNA polymerase sigma factor [Cellulophaga baltica]|jgi:RNA polymerase sigma-70 factor (ECF subfamily)|uniref:RNA polymerase sigma factor n=1 Tax=Cellulophaga TaxID=104264 RepID=UPI001C0708F6|nr:MULTISPECIES: sigma-70 family RNA polymerase sigma factor [Cellulophaga]MBU2997360.1 sigma-70 family RNA polymerase sigma factor [Cellulophaga baltica]MDO6768757.1 sigma-70 family RNA polymerase sigma factor [Cellulophaga sp. 1_MG-2023]